MREARQKRPSGQSPDRGGTPDGRHTAKRRPANAMRSRRRAPERSAHRSPAAPTRDRARRQVPPKPMRCASARPPERDPCAPGRNAILMQGTPRNRVASGMSIIEFRLNLSGRLVGSGWKRKPRLQRSTLGETPFAAAQTGPSRIFPARARDLDVSREVPRRWCIPSLQGATGCHADAHVR